MSPNIFARKSNALEFLKEAFNFGASYSWTKSVAYGVTQRQSKKMGENECGYWTFVPYVIAYASQHFLIT